MRIKKQSDSTNRAIKTRDKVYINFSMLWRKIKSFVPFIKSDRGPFVLGMTSCKVNEFENRLIRNGYQYDYFSFDEEGQVTNMRKLSIINEVNKKVIRQYHIRLYDNGEIRAHDEYAYEQSMFKHLNGTTVKPLPECESSIIYKYIIERFPKNYDN